MLIDVPDWQSTITNISGLNALILAYIRRVNVRSIQLTRLIKWLERWVRGQAEFESSSRHLEILSFYFIFFSQNMILLRTRTISQTIYLPRSMLQISTCLDTPLDLRILFFIYRSVQAINLSIRRRSGATVNIDC